MSQSGSPKDGPVTLLLTGYHFRQDILRVEIGKGRQRVQPFQLEPDVQPYRQPCCDPRFVLVKTVRDVEIPGYQRVHDQPEQHVLLQRRCRSDTGDPMQKCRWSLLLLHEEWQA